MSRNRMRNSQSLHWMGVVKWILIAGLLSGLGLSYMLCKNQNLHLAEQARLAQKNLDAIEARNAELFADLQSMKSSNALKRRLMLIHSDLIAWGDPRASWLPWEQNTRARLAGIGAMPRRNLNLDAVPVAENAAAQQSAH